jgi:hypothetical protein
LHHTEAAPGGGTVSRGATNLVRPTAGLCGLPKRQGIGPDHLQRTDREKYHARRGKRPTTMHRKKEPSAPHGGREWAWFCRLATTVCELCSFRLKESSVTSVKVQSAFLWCSCIPPRRFEDGGAIQRSRPRGRNSFPRGNEPSRTDCGALRSSNTARHRTGSINTHRARKVKRMAREATNKHAPKEIAFGATREPRRRLGGWDPRSMSYAPFFWRIAQSPQ